MPRKTKTKRPVRPRAPNREPGLVAALAEKTGRSGSHISRVISGDRESAALTAELEEAAGMSMAEIRRTIATKRTAKAEKLLLAADLAEDKAAAGRALAADARTDVDG